MKTLLKSTLTLSFGFLFLTASCIGASYAAEYKEMTLRFATANPPGSIHTTCLEKFKEILETESNGKITVNTFFGGSLGDEQSNVKQLRSQEIHATALAGGNLTPFAPSATFYVLPYIFHSREDAHKIIFDEEFSKMMGDRIAKESAARPLAWLAAGYRYLTNSKRPITRMEDLKGLKVRVPPVDVQLEAFRSWGLEPHPLAWSETFNGLQQGVVDGQENPNTVNRDQKFWEVQKYITKLHYTLWVGPLLVSDPWYSRLDADTKALVDKAAYEAAVYAWQWAAEQEDIALQECIDHGMEVAELEDEEKWAEAASGIWPKYYNAIGGKEIIDSALEIIQK